MMKEHSLFQWYGDFFGGRDLRCSLWTKLVKMKNDWTSIYGEGVMKRQHENFFGYSCIFEFDLV